MTGGQLCIAAYLLMPSLAERELTLAIALTLERDNRRGSITQLLRSANRDAPGVAR